MYIYLIPHVIAKFLKRNEVWHKCLLNHFGNNKIHYHEISLNFIVRMVLREFHQTHSYKNRDAFPSLPDHPPPHPPPMYTRLEPMIKGTLTSWSSVSPVVAVVSSRFIAPPHIVDVISGELVWWLGHFDDGVEEDEQQFEDGRQEPIHFAWHLPYSLHI